MRKRPNCSVSVTRSHSPAECDSTRLALCLQEEAVTPLLLRLVVDAVLKGGKKVTIRTVDTLAVALFDKFSTSCAWYWVKLSVLAVCEMVATMDQKQCPTLPIFHRI